jgi:hypothetical protein
MAGLLLILVLHGAFSPSPVASTAPAVAREASPPGNAGLEAVGLFLRLSSGRTGPSLPVYRLKFVPENSEVLPPAPSPSRLDGGPVSRHRPSISDVHSFAPMPPHPLRC